MRARARLWVTGAVVVGAMATSGAVAGAEEQERAMMPMHERMMSSNPEMARMHERIMGSDPVVLRGGSSMMMMGGDALMMMSGGSTIMLGGEM